MKILEEFITIYNKRRKTTGRWYRALAIEKEMRRRCGLEGQNGARDKVIRSGNNLGWS